MSKVKLVAQTAIVGLVMALGVGLASGAEAQTRCKPYTPYKSTVDNTARVVVPNYCSISDASYGVLQRYRGWAVGWRAVNTRDIPAGAARRITWDCQGVGTYTYRGTNTVGNHYLFIGDEARFGC